VVGLGARVAVCWGCGGSREVGGWFRPAGGDRVEYLGGWESEKWLWPAETGSQTGRTGVR